MALLTRTGLRINRYCSMSDFPFFSIQFRGRLCIILPNFAKIGQTVPEIWPIFHFQDGDRPPSWICFTRWDHPRRVFGGLCDCAKFGCNRWSNFDSMQISIFCTLSLKMPIHAPKIWVFLGDFTPKWGAV